MKFYLVGGAVRDQILGLEVSERDWVVVGCEPQEMLDQGFTQIGKDFPVFLHPKTKEEYALARLEQKSGLGHKNFKFKFSKEVTLEQDLKRRDLTINAIAMDEHGNYIDPNNGIKDLDHKLIKHITNSFIEDPLRVFRVARFYAKLKPLGFTVDPQTIKHMQLMTNSGELAELSRERIVVETRKALDTSSANDYFLLLAEIGALAYVSNTLITIITNNNWQKLMQELVNFEENKFLAFAIYAEQVEFTQLCKDLIFPKAIIKIGNSFIKNKTLLKSLLEQPNNPELLIELWQELKLWHETTLPKPYRQLFILYTKIYDLHNVQNLLEVIEHIFLKLKGFKIKIPEELDKSKIRAYVQLARANKIQEIVLSLAW